MKAQQPRPNPISTLARRLLPAVRPERELAERSPHAAAQPPIVQRANRATASDYDRLHDASDSGDEDANRDDDHEQNTNE